MSSEENRFDVTYEQKKGLSSRTRILRDRDTGVSYLQTWDGFAASITLLVNADGSPVVDNGAIQTRDA
jgi:hypothetical protein